VGRVSGYQLRKSAAQGLEGMAVLIPAETKSSDSNKIDLGCGSAGIEYYWNQQQQQG
tara:strand:+ start:3458 stop:3628 length:171 start_codon:yes stop_codon:yes gene_type:complete